MDVLHQAWIHLQPPHFCSNRTIFDQMCVTTGCQGSTKEMSVMSHPFISCMWMEKQDTIQHAMN